MAMAKKLVIALQVLRYVCTYVIAQPLFTSKQSVDKLIEFALCIITPMQVSSQITALECHIPDLVRSAVKPPVYTGPLF